MEWKQFTHRSQLSTFIFKIIKWVVKVVLTRDRPLTPCRTLILQVVGKPREYAILQVREGCLCEFISPRGQSVHHLRACFPTVNIIAFQMRLNQTYQLLNDLDM